MGTKKFVEACRKLEANTAPLHPPKLLIDMGGQGETVLRPLPAEEAGGG